jgi:uncharacterized sporulation protein YeaH/YhbH (DUF444 family)
MSRSFIIDRRLNSKGKSITNRNKFLKRVEEQIKKNIPNILNSQSIKDINNNGTVKVPIKGIEEPTFTYDTSKGTKHRVLPGNPREDKFSKFVEGDKIPKPPPSSGKGTGKGSNDPSVGEDEFIISISKDEFLNYFFEDLELPDLTKKYLMSEDAQKYKRHGYKTDGPFSSLDMVRSYKNSLARRIGMGVSLEETLKKLKMQLEIELTKDESDTEVVNKLLIEIDNIEKQLKAIPYLDDKDLSYKHFEPKPVPNTQAVMFCIMDISGSMGKKEKDIARRFFTLLYLFLTKQYPKVDIIFIQHHTEAKEVNEDKFFNSKENGGTMIKPALELANKIIGERYSSNWNIYMCQASDGDVWDMSDAKSSAALLNTMLPSLQYMAYIEVSKSYSKFKSDLWKAYKPVASANNNFTMKSIKEINEIWTVFKKLFEKKVPVK